MGGELRAQTGNYLHTIVDVNIKVLSIPFIFSEVCKRIKARGPPEFVRLFFVGRPIVVSSCPFGLPRFLIAGGTFKPVHIINIL